MYIYIYIYIVQIYRGCKIDIGAAMIRVASGKAIFDTS